MPYTRSEMGEIPGLLSGPTRVFMSAKMLLFGWPAYLLTHTTGRKYGSRTSHYEPSSPLFLPSQYGAVVLSDIGLCAVFAALAWLTASFGVAWLVKVSDHMFLLLSGTQ